MKITQWELSEIPEDMIQSKNKLFSEGHHIVKIIKAEYLDEYTAEKPIYRDTYSITFEDVNTGDQSQPITYWLKNKERTKFIDSTVGTLNSLGKSIFGPTFAFRIPAPGDIIGAVVDAEFKISKNKDDETKMYNAVYHYNPVSSDNALFSDIEQYYKE